MYYNLSHYIIAIVHSDHQRGFLGAARCRAPNNGALPLLPLQPRQPMFDKLGRAILWTAGALLLLVQFQKLISRLLQILLNSMKLLCLSFIIY